MAEVIAERRGYFGHVLREVGDRFIIPDDVWKDEKRRPTWVRAATKKDAPADAEQPAGEGGGGPADVDVPADWHTLPAADRKALAKAIGGETVPNAKEADAVISAYLDSKAKDGESFEDAPPPVRVSNEINDATGGTQPDWVAPSSGGPKPVAD